MNGQQQLDQCLSCIHDSVLVVVKESKNGKRVDVMIPQLRLVLDGVRTAMDMIGCQPDDYPLIEGGDDLQLLQKGSLKALQAACKNSRKELIATNLSLVLHSATSQLVGMGQVI